VENDVLVLFSSLQWLYALPHLAEDAHVFFFFFVLFSLFFLSPPLPPPPSYSGTCIPYDHNNACARSQQKKSVRLSRVSFVRPSYTTCYTTRLSHTCISARKKKRDRVYCIQSVTRLQ
jgi:hypothetical protein